MSRRDRSVSFGGELKRPNLGDLGLGARKEGGLHEDDEGGGGLKRFGGFEDLMTHRPTKEELINRNILKDDKISPALQGVQGQLKKQILEDNLKGKLAHRPAAEDIAALKPDGSLAV
ncbi:hypothetical protein BDK51DRAFT_29520 [Blyttiomyces helicus]|uniref:Uncharacterized protein n=1 Tax=Blyttiomyces helicus TaxID=388810 RepID=A0A4P9WP90_9FUNG|nr:hypothetical protein BDK51DRAFT_29520 [Blyttiomyces helicus]|eukprot:RKO93933.1 hypothetical protein BDK51DRAFT_29520 [Blyttiomyces helicus]